MTDLTEALAAWRAARLAKGSHGVNPNTCFEDGWKAAVAAMVSAPPVLLPEGRLLADEPLAEIQAEAFEAGALAERQSRIPIIVRPGDPVPPTGKWSRVEVGRALPNPYRTHEAADAVRSHPGPPSPVARKLPRSPEVRSSGWSGSEEGIR